MATKRLKKSHESGEYFQVYEDHSRTLRTWLVAYGIGGPVLFLTNDHVSRTLASSGNARWVAGLFLAGVMLQVGLAAMNKTVMWICYYTEDDDTQWWGKVAYWISRQFWIDLTIDFLSLTVFAVATWLAFNILIRAS